MKYIFELRDLKKAYSLLHNSLRRIISQECSLRLEFPHASFHSPVLHIQNRSAIKCDAIIILMGEPIGLLDGLQDCINVISCYILL